MVIKTEEGWLGAKGKFYASSTTAQESFAKEFHWPKPSVSPRDRAAARPLRVFLAHAKEDKRIVRDLHKRLMDRGVDAWLDEADLLPGQTWRSEITKAIRASDAFLACLSTTAVAKAGYVNSEFKLALEVADEQPEGKNFIIPVRLNACEVPQRFEHIQWVDYFEPGGFDRLLASLHALAAWLAQQGSKVVSPASVTHREHEVVNAAAPADRPSPPNTLPNGSAFPAEKVEAFFRVWRTLGALEKAGQSLWLKVSDQALSDFADRRREAQDCIYENALFFSDEDYGALQDLMKAADFYLKGKVTLGEIYHGQVLSDRHWPMAGPGEKDLFVDAKVRSQIQQNKRWLTRYRNLLSEIRSGFHDAVN